MSQEENILSELTGRFNFLEGKINILRQRRVSLEVGYDKFPEVFDYLVNKMGFNFLHTITGLDEGERIFLIYHLSPDGRIVLNLKTSVLKANPIVKSVMPIFLNAEIYEREIADLLGVKMEGLPIGHRYPLTDDWPVNEFPLRKDWKPHNTEEGVS
ncbi:MAG: NADH-quinone oxidoreductase subunit C [Candidatus Omnitrophica bacterium]|nr:NADH-quinone oxidoreductase subunit C [Candidatus Omnitrophota bacterium]